jgi:hypothetical protein
MDSALELKMCFLALECKILDQMMERKLVKLYFAFENVQRNSSPKRSSTERAITREQQRRRTKKVNHRVDPDRNGSNFCFESPSKSHKMSTETEKFNRGSENDFHANVPQLFPPSCQSHPAS